jgi:transposase
MAVRRWTVEQKRAIVQEYEDAPHGSKSAVLRRHQIARRRVQDWVSHRDAGLLQDKRLTKGWQSRMTPRSENAEIVRLRAEVKRLEAELDTSQRDRWMAEAAADALGKASALLQVMLESAEPNERPDLSSAPASTT